MIPEICRDGVGSMFQLWRQIFHLKTLLNADIQPLNKNLVAQELCKCLTTVDDFNAMHELWIDQCIVDFSALAEKSKVSAGRFKFVTFEATGWLTVAIAFLILFWSLGVLCLSEQMEEVHNLQLVFQGFSAVTKAREYQMTAVLSITTISQCILDSSASGQDAFDDITGKSLHLIDHHANTGLVVMALVKGIEHSIMLHVSSQPIPKPCSTGGNKVQLSATWISGLKPLLSCLLALQTTPAGSHTARRALHRLMRQHSDLLMDCWSPGDFSD